MTEFPLTNGYHVLPQGKLMNLVCCLEMKSAPAGPRTELPSDLSLKRYAAGELTDHRKLFRAIGENLLWFSRLIMSDEKLNNILASPKIESFALMHQGKAIGLLELNFTEEAQCELAFFGLVPDIVGQGWGRALMAEALNRAWAKPIERLWVHTCHYDHPKALAFYQKAGFKPYQLMVEVHDDPRLSGHLPLSAAAHIPLAS